MDELSAYEGPRAGLRGAIVLLAGLGIVVLPEPVAAPLGLVLVYGLAAVAVVSGVMNIVGALRVRELAGWLLPAGVLVLLLGLAALAAPAVVGSILARTLGAAVALAGGLALLSAIRSRLRWVQHHRQLQTR
jgi:short repeat uncharacterized protein DUF308